MFKNIILSILCLAFFMQDVQAKKRLTSKQRREISKYKKTLTKRLKSKELTKTEAKQLIKLREQAYLQGRNPVQEDKDEVTFLANKASREKADFAQAKAKGKIYSIEAYDNTPEKTPEKYIIALKEIALYIKRYGKTLGMPVAKKMFIKKQGPTSVLYMETSQSISQLPKKQIYEIFKPVRDLYAKRALSNSITRENASFLYVYFEDKSIAFSNKKNAMNVIVP